MKMISRQNVKNILKRRPKEMHKGQAGRVLIIAGQLGMAGAAVLTARGALYSGAGLVKISAPREIFDILQVSVTEAMCISRDFCGGQPAADYDFNSYDSIAIGPGLGVSEEGLELLRKVLVSSDGPVVIDADGLNCLCKDLSLLTGRHAATVITPHPGEADRLLKAAGKPGYKDLSRQEVAETLSQLGGDGPLIALLKGSDTLIASAGEMYVNGTGNPGMATGGSGDVLTGIIVSLLAQGRAGAKANAKAGEDIFMDATPLQAVTAAAYLHGLAGDRAAETKGQYGMTSADIAGAVPEAIKEVTGF